MKTNKVAVVTGASRGIGKAVALGLAEDGYDLVLIARTESKLLELEKEIKGHGVKSKIIAEDIREFDAISQAINKVVAEWGRIDLLVNNAGIFIQGTLDVATEDYQALYDVNFKAQLVLLKAVLPAMQQQGGGYVINIASIAGKTGYAGLGAYCSSKFAFVGLSQSLHSEFSSQGIKITAICPAYVATDMAKGANIPESQMIQPKDILETIRWLLRLSPGAYVKEVILNTSD